MKWTKRSGGKVEIHVTIYQLETNDGYRAQMEAYPGVHKKVCEWAVWNPAGIMFSYGVDYDIKDAQGKVVEAIKQDRVVKE